MTIKEWISSPIGKAVGVFVSTVALAAGAYMTDLFKLLSLDDQVTQQERILRNKVIINNIAKEDSLRRDLHRTGTVAWPLMLLQCRNQIGGQLNSAIDRVSLLSWFRSNHNADLVKENYNRLTIRYELSEDGVEQLKQRYQARNLDESMPYLKDYLDNIYMKQRFYAVKPYRRSSYDSLIIPDPLWDVYYTESVQDRVHIMYYLGETSDLNERWFMSVWVDSTSYESPSRYMIVNSVYSTGDEIQRMLYLKK